MSKIESISKSLKIVGLENVLVPKIKKNKKIKKNETNLNNFSEMYKICGNFNLKNQLKLD